MEVKTYRAATMQEALAMVRSDLGPPAAVLHTREIGTGGLLKWLPGMRRIEVTAALEVNVPSRFANRKAGDQGLDLTTAPPRRTAESPVTPRRAADAEVGGVTYESTGRVAPRSQHAAEEVKTQISELQALVADLCRRTRG